MSDKVVLDREDMRRTLVRISHEIVEKTGGSGLAVVGIHRRGAVLAQRVRDLVAELVGEPIPLGDIDISFYRDDVATRSQPTVHSSHIEFPIDGMTVVSQVGVSREREVVVVEVEDRPGVLADLTRKIARAGVNLDLVYVATRNRMVFGADDLEALRAALGER